MNLRLNFYQASFAQLFWCKKDLLISADTQPRTLQSHFVHNAVDIRLHVKVHAGRSDLLGALRHNVAFLKLFALAVLLWFWHRNILHRAGAAAQEQQQQQHIAWQLTQLVFVNVFQRLFSFCVVLSTDVYHVAERMANDGEPVPPTVSLFGPQPALMHVPFSRPTFEIYSHYASIFNFAARGWILTTLLCSNKRAASILLLLVYEIVPLLRWSSYSNRGLLTGRIFAACWQTWVFAKANCWLWSSDTCFWFPAILLHLCLPIALNVGDITHEIF